MSTAGLRALALSALVSALLLVGAAPTVATTPTPFGVNLVQDPGFEMATGGNGTTQNSLPGWISDDSAFTATSYGTPQFPTKKDAKRIGGGKVFASCGDVPSNNLLQRIHLTGLNALIDSGRVRATISLQVATFTSDDDTASVTLHVQDGGGTDLDAVTTGDLTHTQTRFVQVQTSLVLPAQTRQLIPELSGVLHSGSYCDAYFDNVKVTLTKLPSGAAHAGASPRTPFGVNLVKDPGFEQATGGDGFAGHMLPHWDTTNSALTATSYGTPDFPTKSESKRISGGKVFAACGNAVDSDDLLQSISLRGLNSSIDAGRVRATFSVMLATFGSGADLAKGYLEAFSAGQPVRHLLASVTTGDLTSTASRFIRVSTTLNLPKGTRGLSIDLRGTRTSGGYCDAYFDNVSVSITKLP